jgi:hypothetical protein
MFIIEMTKALWNTIGWMKLNAILLSIGKLAMAGSLRDVT